MIVGPPTADELTYIRETALKVLQPPGVRWREWHALRGPEIGRLDADVAREGDMVVGFCLREPVTHIVRLLYVRKRAHGFGIGRVLWGRAWGDERATGIGPWSDLR